MKCVRVVGQGVPIRLSDDDAFQLVHRDGDGEFCSKAFWRRWYKDSGREPLRSRISSTGRIVAL